MEPRVSSPRPAESSALETEKSDDAGMGCRRPEANEVHVKLPSATYAEMARQLLAQEADSARVEAGAETPAARAYDKLNERLTPFLGATGVQLLFAHSAKLTGAALPAGLPRSDPAALRARLAASEL